MKQYKAEDHTFVICAYKESPYLEDCIRSVLHQNVRGKICLTTSTPKSVHCSACSKISDSSLCESCIGRDRSRLEFCGCECEDKACDAGTSG